MHSEPGRSRIRSETLSSSNAGKEVRGTETLSSGVRSVFQVRRGRSDVRSNLAGG
jgi:hypothetical protein